MGFKGIVYSIQAILCLLLLFFSFDLISSSIDVDPSAATDDVVTAIATVTVTGFPMVDYAIKAIGSGSLTTVTASPIVETSILVIVTPGETTISSTFVTTIQPPASVETTNVPVTSQASDKGLLSTFTTLLSPMALPSATLTSVALGSTPVKTNVPDANDQTTEIVTGVLLGGPLLGVSALACWLYMRQSRNGATRDRQDGIRAWALQTLRSRPQPPSTAGTASDDGTMVITLDTVPPSNSYGAPRRPPRPDSIPNEVLDMMRVTSFMPSTSSPPHDEQGVANDSSSAPQTAHLPEDQAPTPSTTANVADDSSVISDMENPYGPRIPRTNDDEEISEELRLKHRADALAALERPASLTEDEIEQELDRMHLERLERFRQGGRERRMGSPVLNYVWNQDNQDNQDNQGNQDSEPRTT